MKELQRKQKNSRLIYSIPSLVILSIITLLLVKGAWGMMNRERESSKRVKELEEKSLLLSMREGELEGNVARLETEEGVKEEIRERFNVVQKGEHSAIIVEGRGVSSSTGELSPPWYKRLLLVILPLYGK